MDEFKKEFLDRYLVLGLGSMPKADIDALVMHLLDKHGGSDDKALCTFSNQEVSELLKTPTVKIKKLRYEAALKFGGDDIEDQAKGRILASLSKATLEPEGLKVRLIIEDSLAKNWLQGKLKQNQQIFDHSFNSEIITVDAIGLFSVLRSIFKPEQINEFEVGYKKAKDKESAEARLQIFKDVAKKFAIAAAEEAGGGVMKILKAQLGIP